MLSTVHALIIERSPEADAIGRIAKDELMDWLALACIEGVSLVVVSLPDALELYAVGAERSRAFRIVLRSLRDHLKTQPACRDLRTAELVGSAAVHRLFSRAGGLLSNGEPFDAAAIIHASATLSSEVGSLGSRLGPLFAAATVVHHRVVCETNFNARESGEHADVERLAAERIVEEEFTSYRSRVAEHGHLRRRSSRPPGFNHTRFELHERASLLRVRLTRRQRPARLA